MATSTDYSKLLAFEASTNGVAYLLGRSDLTKFEEDQIRFALSHMEVLKENARSRMRGEERIERVTITSGGPGTQTTAVAETTEGRKIPLETT